jgi:hypothetical protein
MFGAGVLVYLNWIRGASVADKEVWCPCGVLCLVLFLLVRKPPSCVRNGGVLYEAEIAKLVG